MSNRKPIFEQGARYRSKQSFMSGPVPFIANEILIFRQDGYSWYDNSFVYEFHSETDGQDKVWFLNEGDDPESWRQFFEPLPGPQERVKDAR